MKRTLFGAVLLSIASICPAETKQALTLHMTSGADIVYFLDTEPSISFHNQNMVVMTDNSPTDIPMQDIYCWEIGMAEFTGKTLAMEVAPLTFRVYSNTLTVINPQQHEIAVYTATGQLVASGHQSEVQYTLPHGVYMITDNNNTYKIAIR